MLYAEIHQIYLKLKTLNYNNVFTLSVLFSGTPYDLSNSILIIKGDQAHLIIV